MKFQKFLLIVLTTLGAAYLIDSNFSDAIGAIGVLILGIWYSIKNFHKPDLKSS